jgi:hypothetical protein
MPSLRSLQLSLPSEQRPTSPETIRAPAMVVGTLQELHPLVRPTDPEEPTLADDPVGKSPNTLPMPPPRFAKGWHRRDLAMIAGALIALALAVAYVVMHVR